MLTSGYWFGCPFYSGKQYFSLIHKTVLVLHISAVKWVSKIPPLYAVLESSVSFYRSNKKIRQVQLSSRATGADIVQLFDLFPVQFLFFFYFFKGTYHPQFLASPNPPAAILSSIKSVHVLSNPFPSKPSIVFSAHKPFYSQPNYSSW